MVHLILMSLAIAIVPAILFSSILYLLSARSNGIRAMIKLFAVGFIATIPVVVCGLLFRSICVEQDIDEWSVIDIFGNVYIEEGWKLLGALLGVKIFKLKFNSWNDAVLVGFIVGVGFGFAEDILCIKTYFDSYSFWDLVYTNKNMIGLHHPLYTVSDVLALFFFYKRRFFLAASFLLITLVSHFMQNINIIRHYNIPTSPMFCAIYIGIVAVFTVEKILSSKRDNKRGRSQPSE